MNDMLKGKKRPAKKQPKPKTNMSRPRKQTKPAKTPMSRGY